LRSGEFRRPQSENKNEKHAINERISAPEVRVIGAGGEQLGVLKTRQALMIAEEAGLDLVEVAPEAKPPVCKILDYGKLKYREQKKASDAKKKNTTHTTKELRLRYNTDKHDLEVKVRSARKFLGGGDKVRFEMRFKGREAVYVDLGKEMLKQVEESLADVAIVEETSPLFGQKLSISFAPKSLAIVAKPPQQPKPAQKETPT
jgi:translation initiation factor IF-3